MNLTEFLQKWESPGANRLSVLLHSMFGCDIRTFQKWKHKTPRQTQISLALIDKLWESTGKNYNIFFEI